MRHFMVILFALVSLVVITCKATPWKIEYNSNPAKKNLHSGNYAHSKPAQKTSGSAKVADVSKNNKNYYMQVLVYVDYGLHSLFKNKEEVRKYVMSFWKGVDLRLRALKSVNISISIAGIIIAESPSDTPYLQKHLRGTSLQYNDAVMEFAKYMFLQKNIPIYDVAVQMTTLDMCYGHQCLLTGAAGPYGACTVNNDFKEASSVAIVEDYGGYSGIIAAAHELGHLLGSPHDGEGPYDFAKLPGSKNCPRKAGYIMGEFNEETTNMFRWSSCSEQNILTYLKTPAAKCLLDGPHENSFEGIPLPGETMSLDEQCLRDYGTKIYETTTSPCKLLSCVNSKKHINIGGRPAAEGSPCGKGLHCMNGECVSQSSNGSSRYYG